MSATRQIILGAPGCGKTTRLLQIMDDLMKQGVRPERIAFVSFTRKAAHEAAERAMKKFSFNKQQLPYFRTLHSLAYAALRVSHDALMKKVDYEEIGRMLGVEFLGYQGSIEEGLPVGSGDGDKMLFIDSFARARMMDLRDAWEEVGDDSVDWYSLRQFSDTLATYKRDHGLMDYTDLLQECLRNAQPLDIDVAIIDEAQDLSTLQWEMAEMLISRAKQVYIAGDDDQAIYRWSGADVDRFLALDGDIEVLDHSHRLPRQVYSFANRITRQIGHRFEKEWTHRDEEGVVEYVQNIDSIDMSEGTWLILVRNVYMMKDLIEMVKRRGHLYAVKGRSAIKDSYISAIRIWERLRKGDAATLDEVKEVYAHIKSGQGITRGYKQLKGATDQELYTLQDLRDNWGLTTDSIWHEALTFIPIEDRTYMVAALSSGEKITERPRINISTIHGVKGGEADNVILLPDMAYRTYMEFQANPDDEHRVFYVGATRARDSLYVCAPSSRFYYPL